MTTPRGPVVIDIDETEGRADPDAAAPIGDDEAPPEGQAAMQRLARISAGGPNKLAGWFWGLLGAIVLTLGSVAMWAAVAAIIAQSAWLGTAITLLLALFGLVCLGLTLRELAAIARLGRIDKLQTRAVTALSDDDLGAARKVVGDLRGFYAGRPELRWGSETLDRTLETVFDADATLGLAETELLATLDREATARVEAAARQVATITAIVPLAFADIFAAASANLRMIRQIAEVYGGRAGTIGTWRLMRAVLTHLVATGAVAVGDDLIHSVAGGSVLSRVSRRFGEGIVNGALTARVGIAAIEVCRPLPFNKGSRPSVTGIMRRSVTGVFRPAG